MRLIQFLNERGERRVASVESHDSVRVLSGVFTTYHLAQLALAGGESIEQAATRTLGGEVIDYEALVAERRLLLPVDHPDEARCMISGTGLSHLGSAQARDAMHAKLAQSDSALTDSMRMFKLGVEGGKPAGGGPGVAPEWFYKGDGRCAMPPEHALVSPAFALDGGDEAEIAGIYMIDDTGQVRRLGYALGNEFSDHVTEKQNYLYLAHSKLRPCSYGPELLLGELPKHVRGTARVLREGVALWSSDWLSGDDNMCHSVANLEHHHFKYAHFRRPGDLHVHYLGAAALSVAGGLQTRAGDVFEIGSALFGRPLRNRYEIAPPEAGPVITAL